MDDRFISNDTIKAVYSDDLDKLLASKGLMNDFLSGNMKCKYCSKVITKQNLFALIPEAYSLSFCCDEPECTEMMISESAFDNELPETTAKLEEK